jgi:type I restriction-modification system DNA methylase subunit
VVANPPFSYRWEPTEALGEDVRFKNYGLAPKSAADFAFLLHGITYNQKVRWRSFCPTVYYSGAAQKNGFAANC